ncbi:MAG: ECF transporter S component [Oscillospiraceae bacterium]
MQNTKTRKMVIVAIFAAIATVLRFLEFPLPFLPPFLKLDISSVPIMVGSFMFGPLAGVAMAAVKALVCLFATQTAGVGELADFLITGSFALTAGLVYKYHKNRKGALLASVASIATTTVVGAIANYYILLPFYAQTFMPMEAILEACQKVNPNITSISTYILYGVVPFNIIKGTVIALVTFAVYKKLSGWIHRYTESGGQKEKKVASNRR